MDAIATFMSDTPDQLARHDKAKDYQAEAEGIAKDFALIALNAMNFDTSLESVKGDDLVRIAHAICCNKNGQLASLLEARDQLEELKHYLSHDAECAIGNEHEDYSALQQLKHLHLGRDYWRKQTDQLRSQLAAEKQAHRECHAGMVKELEKAKTNEAIAVELIANGEKKRKELEKRLAALRQSSGALYNWIQGNVTIDDRTRDVMNRLYEELDKGVKENKPCTK